MPKRSSTSSETSRSSITRISPHGTVGLSCSKASKSSITPALREHCVLCLKSKTGSCRDRFRSSSRSCFSRNSMIMSSGYQMAGKEITDDLDLLLQVMPPHLVAALRQQPDFKNLIEIVLDLGRLPEARFPDRAIYLTDTA